ncbi:hypothetical protein C0J52_03856 [Blattella germanica]|nr:hypothetical protein C0J52_03856 [Blattella germanica]
MITYKNKLNDIHVHPVKARRMDNTSNSQSPIHRELEFSLEDSRRLILLLIEILKLSSAFNLTPIVALFTQDALMPLLQLNRSAPSIYKLMRTNLTK